MFDNDELRAVGKILSVVAFLGLLYVLILGGNQFLKSAVAILYIISAVMSARLDDELLRPVIKTALAIITMLIAAGYFLAG